MQQGLKERVSFEEAVQKLSKVVVPNARPGNGAQNNVTPLQSRTLSHGTPPPNNAARAKQ
jgi:hypothetical protein